MNASMKVNTSGQLLQARKRERELESKSTKLESDMANLKKQCSRLQEINQQVLEKIRAVTEENRELKS
jgi:hypothetical protein